MDIYHITLFIAGKVVVIKKITNEEQVVGKCVAKEISNNLMLLVIYLFDFTNKYLLKSGW